ncbi:hypothetical protein FC699_06970 [Bacillus wiedmannii]|uniref:Uncharacterized protein n=1 Tax=Bacillus wiedmannii TaxID=1890302 RepID=A0A4U3B8J8_9BACI|nr:hypothetical protein FC694_23860 [Bacillus wiedmannii]TKI97637.1 hypothetical protein FC699_06970 [Bacillus wiedmannii]
MVSCNVAAKHRESHGDERRA